MPSKKIVHLHNYRCDGKIIQSIMKQNGGWPYEVDGEKGASFFLHLIMFQKENGIEPTGYFLAGSKAEDQLFALADGKHKNITGARHLGEAFVDNDLRFGNPSPPDKWQVPEADKAKIVKVIHELAGTFHFPDIEIKDEEIELTPDGKVIFEPVMSIKYWLQKDGSISEDYPLSVHHRLNSAFTNAGFKVIEASPKGVRVESISQYEAAGQLTPKMKNEKTGFLLVTEYIFNEMKKNIASSDAAYISDQNNKYITGEGIPASPAGMDIGPFYDPAPKFKAYNRWFDKVRQKHDWDHKKEFGKGKKPEYAYDSQSNLSYQLEAWSNIHYGYVGMSVGFTRTELVGGAGVAQIINNAGLAKGWQDRLKEAFESNWLDIPAAFDEAEDKAAVDIGIDLWKKSGSGLTLVQLQAMVRNRASQLKTKKGKVK